METESKTASFEPDPVHYYEDGNVIFLVGSFKFRVSKSIMARRSSLMHDMFSLPQSQETATTSSDDGVPAITLHEDPEAFRDLLNFIIPQSPITPTLSERRLIRLFFLCRKYCFEPMEAWCNAELKNQLPVDFATMGRLSKYKEDPSLALEVIRGGEGMSPFAPLALYVLATHEWAEDSEIMSSLSAAEMHLLLRGLRSIQKDVLEGPAVIHDDQRCPHGGFQCKLGLIQMWRKVEERRVERVMRPLEELNKLSLAQYTQVCAPCQNSYRTTCTTFCEGLIARLPSIFGVL